MNQLLSSGASHTTVLEKRLQEHRTEQRHAGHSSGRLPNPECGLHRACKQTLALVYSVSIVARSRAAFHEQIPRVP